LDLAFSLLFGLTINLLIMAAVISVLAWLIAEQVGLAGLVNTDNSSGIWTFNPSDRPPIALLWGPAVLIALSVLFFLITRYLPPEIRYLLANPVRWRVFRPSPRRPSGAEPMWNSWFSNTKWRSSGSAKRYMCRTQRWGCWRRHYVRPRLRQIAPRNYAKQFRALHRKIVTRHFVGRILSKLLTAVAFRVGVLTRADAVSVVERGTGSIPGRVSRASENVRAGT